MVVRSIIDVEIEDDAFKRFHAIFERYQKQLAATRGDWGAVAKEIGVSKKGFEALLAVQLATAATSKRIAAAQHVQRLESNVLARAWGNIAGQTKTVASNIERATRSLLRWGAITGVVSGLLGAGGLFGIDRLAAGVAGGRRASLGLGIGYGARRAFQANFGRLVNPDAFLEAVAGARLDVTKRVGLIGAGLTPQQLQGDTGSIAIALLRQLKQIADVTQPALYAQVIAARQLGQFVSPTDLLRLRSTSQGELQQLFKAYQNNRGAFGLTDSTAKAWQDFTTQMGRAAQGIETTFVRGLLPLERPLERLSVAFEHTISAFLGSETIKRLLDQAAKGLDTFSKYLGTDKFQKDVQDFARDLGIVAQAVGKAVHWAAGVVAPPAGSELARQRAASAARVGGLRAERAAGRSAFSQLGDIMMGRAPAQVEAYIREAARKRGIDPDVAVRVARSEGLYKYTGDVDATGKPTSFGPYQLHYAGTGRFTRPGLGEQFSKYTGLDARDRSTVRQQIDYALDYAKTHGWGAWHGWRGSPWAGIDGGAKVTIENNTGGSAIVTTNQVAQ